MLRKMLFVLFVAMQMVAVAGATSDVMRIPLPNCFPCEAR